MRARVSIFVSLFSIAVAGCGGSNAASSGSAGPSSSSPPSSLPPLPPHPPPLSAPDKHEAWKGPHATVYEIPSMKMLEVIANSEAAGVAAEYEWLKLQRCGDGSGDWTTHEQSTFDKDDRQYDVLHCVCSTTGETKDFTFDITQYFGIDLR